MKFERLSGLWRSALCLRLHSPRGLLLSDSVSWIRAAASYRPHNVLANEAAASQPSTVEISSPLNLQRTQMPGPKRKTAKPSTLGNSGREVPDEKWCLFLAELSRTANVTRSCEFAGISRTVVYDRKREDPEFLKQHDEAYRRGYEVLEEECQRRAFSGFEKPVFYKGKKVATVIEFSDPLAMFLLKGNTNGKFRERVETTSGDGGSNRFSKLSEEDLEAELKRRLG